MRLTYKLNLSNSPFNKSAFAWADESIYVWYDPMRDRAGEALFDLSESACINELDSLVTKRSDLLNKYEARLLQEEEEKARARLEDDF